MRTAVLVSTPIKSDLPQAIAQGTAPRRDYFELRDALGAEMISPPLPTGIRYTLAHKLVGMAPAMAWVAWTRRRDYDLILTDQEASGLILALLFKLTRTKRGHVMISHYLTPAKKQIFYTILRVQNHIDVTVCYSSAQKKLAREKMHLAPDQVSLVLHPADSRFWRPAASSEEIDADQELLRQAGIYLREDEQLVCSAGLEFRDYPTLVKAMQRMPENVRVIIAAASPWSKRKNTTEDVELPENLQRVALTPLQLRALYRRADVVAIPLFDVDFQAGSLVAYEAMACGKAVVITHTRGQGDIVVEDHTGLYVEPGDHEAMAATLNYLLSDPMRACSLGENARRIVENGLNLDTYLTNMIDLVRNVAARRAIGQQVGKQITEAKQVLR
ncbi:MAG: glycosyltransferase family 4 protein [Chloroflexi bacterium]|nr:glycosyltransferase family 4 protein [Chloroflexota bacterium]